MESKASEKSINAQYTFPRLFDMYFCTTLWRVKMLSMLSNLL
jgi:hypothetical protein